MNELPGRPFRGSISRNGQRIIGHVDGQAIIESSDAMEQKWTGGFLVIPPEELSWGDFTLTLDSGVLVACTVTKIAIIEGGTRVVGFSGFSKSA